MVIDARRAIELRISNLQSHPQLKNDGFIRNIKFNNIDAHTNRSCYILGFGDTFCSDIEFNNFNLSFDPEPDDERSKCNYFTFIKQKTSNSTIIPRENACSEIEALDNGAPVVLLKKRGYSDQNRTATLFVVIV